MPKVSADAFWTVIAILVTIILALLTLLSKYIAEVGRRNEKKWKQALHLSRILSDDSEGQLTKDIAVLQLADLGYGVLPPEPAPGLLIGLRSKLEREPPQEQLAQLNASIERAVEKPANDQPAIDPDLERVKAVINAARHFSGEFERNYRSGRAMDDLRLRIFFVLCIYLQAFIALAIRHVYIFMGSPKVQPLHWPF